MLNLLRRGASAFETLDAAAVASGWSVPADTVWIDLVSPSREEELAVEQALGFDLPTPAEMAQIEPSSRLYQDNGETFMTASLLAHSGDEHPVLRPVTFVLSHKRLITIRYDALRAFTVYAQRAVQPGSDSETGGEALMGLLDAIVERLAEVLERGADQVEASSNAIFDRPRGTAFEPLLTGLARTQSTASLARTSLVSLGRLAGFAGLAPEVMEPSSCQAHLASIRHDLQSLTEHSGYQASHIAFLLDAALGLINIEQNNNMKVFAVATVLLMPPTLVGAIYGMNFRHMPELDWVWGYPFALAIMAASGLVPFLWFRKKGWF
ncbi:MAG TPA: magnesium transporter CorA family protein [Phenylobacterium sp.]|nr:magnesium transporter CorA family protein [Phenylobacterium sp.]